MNHPEREAWIPYVFGEADPEARQALEAHLRACDACRTRVEAWRASLKRLDRWEVAVPRRVESAWPVAAVLRWAAVVVLSVAAGALGGAWAVRGSTAGGTTAAAPVALTEGQVRAWVETAVARERATTRDALEQARSEQDARLFELRRDLETVAATTEVALRQARRGLLEVAGYRPAPR